MSAQHWKFRVWCAHIWILLFFLSSSIYGMSPFPLFLRYSIYFHFCRCQGPAGMVPAVVDLAENLSEVAPGVPESVASCPVSFGCVLTEIFQRFWFDSKNPGLWTWSWLFTGMVPVGPWRQRRKWNKLNILRLGQIQSSGTWSRSQWTDLRSHVNSQCLFVFVGLARGCDFGENVLRFDYSFL